MSIPEVLENVKVSERQAIAWSQRGIRTDFLDYMRRNGQIEEGRGPRVYVKLGMASLCACGRRKHTDAKMCKESRFQKGLIE